jgi:hypothetical protein
MATSKKTFRPLGPTALVVQGKQLVFGGQSGNRVSSEGNLGTLAIFGVSPIAGAQGMA